MKSIDEEHKWGAQMMNTDEEYTWRTQMKNTDKEHRWRVQMKNTDEKYENFSLIWRRHHNRWRAANFRCCCHKLYIFLSSGLIQPNRWRTQMKSTDEEHKWRVQMKNTDKIQIWRTQMKSTDEEHRWKNRWRTFSSSSEALGLIQPNLAQSIPRWRRFRFVQMNVEALIQRKIHNCEIVEIRLTSVLLFVNLILNMILIGFRSFLTFQESQSFINNLIQLPKKSLMVRNTCINRAN